MSVISVFDVLVSHGSKELQCKVNIIDDKDDKSSISLTTMANEDNFSANFIKLDEDDLENPMHDGVTIEKKIGAILNLEGSSLDPVQSGEEVEEAELLIHSPVVAGHQDRGDDVLSTESSKKEIALLSKSDNAECQPNSFNNGYLLENSNYQISAPNHVQRMSDPLGMNSSTSNTYVSISDGRVVEMTKEPSSSSFLYHTEQASYSTSHITDMNTSVATPGNLGPLPQTETAPSSESKMQETPSSSQSYERIILDMQELIKRGYQVPYVPHPSQQTIFLDDPIDICEDNVEVFQRHEHEAGHWDGGKSDVVSHNSLSECIFSINPLHFEHADFEAGYNSAINS